MSTTTPILHVTGRLIGRKSAGANGTLTGEGWAVYSSGTTTVYKNKLAYDVYDKKADRNARPQFIDVTCFGDRYKWISENIGKKNMVHIAGKMSFEPTMHNGNPYAGINLEVIDMDFSNENSGAPGAPSTQRTQAAAPAAQTQAPAQSQPQDDEDLPF